MYMNADSTPKSGCMCDVMHSQQKTSPSFHLCSMKQLKWIANLLQHLELVTQLISSKQPLPLEHQFIGFIHRADRR
jgi:hypothetical protein